MNFHNHCLCVGCINTDPGTTTGAGWASKTSLTWEPENCSTAYNVYRKSGLLLDSDHNGVAEEYGQCFSNDVGGTGTSDSSSPPVGSLLLYAVTGQNLNGEGALGYASNGGIRPNVTPCP